MRKISQIQYKKVDADIKPFRKTVLSIIDDHMYLIQSYKYDQNLDVWLNSKVTSFLNEDGESVFVQLIILMPLSCMKDLAKYRESNQMKIKRALNTFKEKVTETADSLTETLDNIQDSATTKLNDVKKSTLGRKVTYLMGGDPNADRVLDCDKRDLPDDPDNKVVQELDDFFKDQEDSNNEE